LKLLAGEGGSSGDGDTPFEVNPAFFSVGVWG
jgi:hypothetical protein